MVKLKVKEVEFSYASVLVLKDICIELAASEMLGVVGPNGTGKSTLLRCIDRILSPQKGCILLDGEDIKKMSRMELAKKMGYIPQSSSQIFPATVFDVVLMGRRPHLNWRSSEEEVNSRKCLSPVLSRKSQMFFCLTNRHQISTSDTSLK
jgi:iron complex transport system ATP-binding protein